MLKELIDKYYRERQKDREQTHFYITDAGKCPRAVFFKFKKAFKEEMEPRVLRLFDYGDQIHQFILKPLFSMGTVRSSEISIPPQQIISGRADAVVSFGNELYVLDIKSMNSMVFQNLERPKEEHLYQVQLYLHFFEIKRGLLLYVNKDTLDLKEFIFEYDALLAKKLLLDFYNLKTKIDSNIIPSRLDSWPEGWQCKYCQFKEICKIAESGEMNWDEFKNKIKSEPAADAINDAKV
ncbi:MAG: hypothetical protein COV69_00880 [Parcubacteria group bacterium CG11_big_fil_rev_8_21_14_0_20_39_14]|nr:MAG: hypothetical protein COV69_00880 [Parcubacteria group bacterium CG11_big_fil_rev_8_21_14_0_20_39_14]PIS35564.1 MAG: hypothetical protein COT36_01680 [Parcubacteria group bacterium CG08_land_8_20_14_0_20_38_56]